MTGFSFVVEFLKNPRTIGGILPSSTALSKGIREIVEKYLVSNSVILEIGAGTGALTRHLVPLNRPMVALEPNKKLRGLLQQEYPQVRTLPHSLQQAEKILLKDFRHQPLIMVSSLPFASLSKSHKREIKTILGHILKNSPGSVLIQYTYWVIDPLDFVKGDIRSKKEKTVLRNVPPAHVWSYCYSGRH